MKFFHILFFALSILFLGTNSALGQDANNANGQVLGVEPAAGTCLNGTTDYDSVATGTNCAIYFRMN